ncbi:MAG TPA: hypothetical protein VK922_16365 [Gemmatimonadaceae bacterium]|nr:hypothetical protein [Gemmatimonadaceae bacterium]
MFAVTSVITPPLVILLAVAAAACSDSTGTSRDAFSGTYVLSGLIDESACAPAPWPGGDWSSFELPSVGQPAGAIWQASRSSSSISVTNVEPDPQPDEPWQFTAPLADDLTFSFSRTLSEGTVTTDAGVFDLLHEEGVSGSIQVEPTARITARQEQTFTFSHPDDGTLFTTCTMAAAMTGTRTS